MCIFKKSKTEFPVCPPQKTVEQLITEKSAGMNDDQMAAYWFELDSLCFALLGECKIDTWEITAQEFESAIRNSYPTITDLKIGDGKYLVTNQAGIEKVLKRDWTNKLKYVAEFYDCEDFAVELAAHFRRYYKLETVIQVWGDTSSGYHGFNLAVMRKDDGTLEAKLIEPQTDKIFVDQGDLGNYIPRTAVRSYGVLN